MVWQDTPTFWVHILQQSTTAGSRCILGCRRMVQRAFIDASDSSEKTEPQLAN